MSKVAELLREGRTEELWQRCCGFIDLSMDEFMAIQKRLLLEQLELLKRCDLGRHIMNGAYPFTVEEFREQVPMTTYADYCPGLLEQREDILNKLGEMSQVETIREEELMEEVHPSLFKKAAGIPRLKNRIRKTFFVTLKNG